MAFLNCSQCLAKAGILFLTFSIFCLPTHAQETIKTFTFASPDKYTLGSEVNAITKGDFNGDGSLDLAVATSDGFIHTLLNDGRGKFTTGTPYAFAVGEMESLDLDDDGRDDLTMSTSSSLATLANNGSGVFSNPKHYFINNNFGVSLTINYFFGDLKKDIAINSVYYFGDFPSVLIYRNSDKGVLTLGSQFGPGGGAYKINSGDLNNDGFADIIVTNTNVRYPPYLISVNLNDGTGEFLLGDTYTIGHTGFKIAIVDIDEDGINDAAYTPSERIRWLKNKGSGSFQPERDIPGTLSNVASSQLFFEDFDNDSHFELITSDKSKITITPGIGKGEFAPTLAIPIGTLNSSQPNLIQTGDFDGDGAKDLVYANADSKGVSVIRNFTPQKTGSVLKVLEPKSGDNTDSVVLSILDTEQDTGDSYQLVGVNGATLSGTDSYLYSEEKRLVKVRFDLFAAPPGLYDLVVTRLNGVSRILKAAFTVSEGGYSKVWVNISGRQYLRGAREQLYFLDYGNSGNASAYNNRFWIKVPDFVELSLPFDLLAHTHGAVDGFRYYGFDAYVLTPGETKSIPIKLKAPDTLDFGHRKFKLKVWQENR